MKRVFVEMVLVFLLFFIGAVSIILLDNICFETTGYGGKLVLHVDK